MTDCKVRPGNHACNKRRKGSFPCRSRIARRNASHQSRQSPLPAFSPRCTSNQAAAQSLRSARISA
eukprot:2867893-Pyramimonas_sp.AAC.1